MKNQLSLDNRIWGRFLRNAGVSIDNMAGGSYFALRANLK